MAFLLVLVGETIFADLGRIPVHPTAPSYCQSAGVVYGGRSRNSDFYYYDNYNLIQYTPCTFNEIDKKFGIDLIYEKMKPTLEELDKISKQVSTVQSQISQSNYSIRSLEERYNLSLQEKIANEQVLYNRQDIQNQISQARSTLQSNQSTLSSLQSRQTQMNASLESLREEMQAASNRAYDYYRRQVTIFSFKIFLLQLLFALPFFIISTFKYFDFKRRNSPYTVIATAVMVSSGLLFLQTLMVFLYRIIPWEWLQIIWNFLQKIPALRYILYYGSAILIILVFGGLVYLIQKKIFSSDKVKIRRIKEKKCPTCSYGINEFQDFCPKCGTQLKEPCASCGNKRIKMLPFCPVCGKTKNAAEKNENLSAPMQS
jgi:hypothetical protein